MPEEPLFLDLSENRVVETPPRRRLNSSFAECGRQCRKRLWPYRMNAGKEETSPWSLARSSEEHDGLIIGLRAAPLAAAATTRRPEVGDARTAGNPYANCSNTRFRQLRHTYGISSAP